MVHFVMLAGSKGVRPPPPPLRLRLMQPAATSSLVRRRELLLSATLPLVQSESGSGWWSMTFRPTSPAPPNGLLLLAPPH